MSCVNENFQLTNQVWGEFQHPENTTVQKVTYAFGLVIAALIDSIAYLYNSFFEASEVVPEVDMTPVTLWAASPPTVLMIAR